MIVRETGPVVYSASDLTAASVCEWALMRKLDARLGRIPAPPEVEDAMLLRAGELGDRHEQRVLAELRSSRQVVEIERPAVDQIEVATEQTLQALKAGAEVVFQAAFFDGRLLGYADFIVLGADGRYEVYDTKLARKAKITALLQLAAYSDHLIRLGFDLGERVHLWLGDGETSSHRLRDILPVYRKRRERLQQIIDARVADPEPTPWNDPRYSACGRCATCSEQVELHRDVLLVAGMKLTQRATLRAAGIESIDDLAVRAQPVDGVSESTLAGLRAQAAMQLEPVTAGHPVPFAVLSAAALEALPPPSAGDLFFDFEGDPLHHEGGLWGLDYLFGVTSADGSFRAFWAHDLAGERTALVEFLEFVRARRAEHPDLHIYHYASYERTHLLLLAARHGVGEEQVDDLLRGNVLVDLYPVVRQGLRIGSRSYSLKKLEPLYMGDHSRTGTANAADSVAEYVRYTELVAEGETDAAAAVLADIARYNEYDCLSTLRLRDWLLERVGRPGDDGPAGEAPSLAAQAPQPALIAVLEREPDPVYLALAVQVADIDPGLRTADQTALALAAAAIDYHRREDKSFWWQHFDRLKSPVDDWADTRDVFVIDSVEVVRDWSVVGSARNASRELIVTGQAAPGSRFSASTSPFVLFDPPYPPLPEPPAGRGPATRPAHDRVSFTELPDGRFSLIERLATGAAAYPQFPSAVTPPSPPKTDKVRSAIAEWGAHVLAHLPAMVPDAALDILRRQPPCLRSSATSSGTGLHRGSDTVSAIVASLLDLDRSYIAVQGPPGTGKTYTGARVIRDLVLEHGWKIGVVAQSHATVENMLAGVIEAGVPAALVGKKPKAEIAPATTATATGSIAPARDFMALTDKSTPGFVQQAGGMVYGGTQWNFANNDAVPRDTLDLLVIDEAGQFSLAATIAAGVSAKRILLLGDPQQLPQVSQGTHPEPVDESALGWLNAGHNVLPPEFGYFLEATRRMHPALCAPVSQLSYDGLLHSAAPERELEGVAPGLHAVPVIHSGDSTQSLAEAEAVVGLAGQTIGRRLSEAGISRFLDERDVIVVAPYNAQVQLIRERLRAAGLPEVRVGTVDTFQGQEAVVAIVSLAASAADDVPRGLEFLLLANRLNVAISRAQWAAYLVYSPALTEHLPSSIAGLAQLSAFITLVESAAHD